MFSIFIETVVLALIDYMMSARFDVQLCGLISLPYVVNEMLKSWPCRAPFF